MTRAAVLVCALGATIGLTVRIAAQRPSGTARISGVIATDDAQPAPIGGAVVTISGDGLGRARSVITDARGAFAFSNLPAGRFALSASKAPFLTMSYGARRPGRQGTAVSVAAGQDVRDISLKLPRGGVITGSIRDETGAPIGDVAVSAARVGEITRVGIGSTSPSAVTDERGTYRIYGLSPGEYLVAATFRSVGSGNTAMPSSSEVDRVLSELQRRGANPPPGGVSAAQPVPALATSQGYSLAPTFYPGTVSAADAERVTIGIGDERRVDFTIEPVRAGSIEGVVQGLDGSPLAGATPSLDAQGPVVSLTFGQVPTLAIRPGADGRFKFTGVTPGRYALTLRSGSSGGRGSGPAAAPAGWAEVEIVSSGDDITGVVLGLQPGRRFDGSLVFEGTSARPADLSKLRVNISSTRGVRTGAEFGLAVAPGGASPVTADGAFAITNITPGPYSVAAPVPGPWWIRSVMVGGKDALDEGLTIPKDADVIGAAITYTDKHSELSGSLQTAGNAPAPDFFVVVLPTEKSWWKPSARRIKSTRPASDGHFSFVDLPGGEYYLAALTDVTPEDLSDPAFLAQIVPAAVKVVVTDGGKTTQALRIGG